MLIEEQTDRAVEAVVEFSYGQPLDPVGIVIPVEEMESDAPPVPQFMLDEMKWVMDKYNKVHDILILPEYYLSAMNISETYFTERGIKTIVFPDDVLLKPSLVKVNGSYAY